MANGLPPSVLPVCRLRSVTAIGVSTFSIRQCSPTNECHVLEKDVRGASDRLLP